MRPHSHLVIIPMLTVAVAIASARACAAAACPADTILGASSGDPQATMSKTVGSPALTGMSASYDLSAGTMSGMYWSAIGDGSSANLLRLNDEYVVDGLDAGTPVPLVIYLDMQASMVAGGQYSYWLYGSDGDYVHRQGGYSGDWTDTMDLMKTVTAGVPFRLHFSLNGLALTLGYSKVTESAALRFEGLPPGARITSCQGFQQVTVPVHAQTWGSVKAFYR